MSTPAPAELESITRLAPAAALLQPLRLELLQRLREPGSAAEVAAALGLPRQQVNYHVRELARVGFLKRAGRRRRRNFYEQRWVATAHSYLLAPTLLGALGALGPLGELPLPPSAPASANWLLAAGSRLQHELLAASQEAAARGEELPILALDAELRFTSAAQRRRFATALAAAVEQVVAAHTAPASAGRGHRFRLLVACHPAPTPPSPPIDPVAPAPGVSARTPRRAARGARRTTANARR